jgi:putative FmdB family regulatory protein
MPIYAYKCSACGHAQDVLQKMSDEPLTVCPACHGATYSKQVTAAGFQLKGSGWYVTDFRDGGKKADKSGDKSSDKGGDKSADASAAGVESKPAADGAATTSKPASETAAAPAPTPAAPTTA